MRVLVTMAATCAALSLLALSAPAQQAPPSQTNDEIVVTGERMRSILRDFVGDISAPANSSDHQLARWDHRICTGVFGMTNRDQAQFIADRIAQRAFAIGLDASPPGCRADIVIFVTPDANALSHTLATEYRGLLAVRRDVNRHAPDLATLDNFANSSRPVRWWHVTDTVSADGMRIGEPSGNMMQTGGRAVRVFSPSRLRSAVRQDFDRVIIVVDARQAAGHTLSALADYLAMVSLAQLSPSIETASYPSVLNLFSGDRSINGLTNFDMAYLDGLYHAPRSAYSSRQQEGQIVDRMEQTLNQASPSPQAPAQPTP
ncbi:MAG: hypothetical protein HY054_03920 [Proteobacteria bacterium]|nr:hypothetical protein [Pseudomonadota bacterium]